jgi:hypothetical protein
MLLNMLQVPFVVPSAKLVTVVLPGAVALPVMLTLPETIPGT